MVAFQHQKYSSGMQTWEYAPQYELRTYAYLLPLAGVARVHQCILGLLTRIISHPSLHKLLSSALLFGGVNLGSDNNDVDDGSIDIIDDKPLLFAALRATLAAASCYSELSFLRSILRNNRSGRIRDSQTVAIFTALLDITSAGNFHSGPAYLPSSTVMILWRLSASNQIDGNDAYAVLWGLVAVLMTGWPFCAVLFVTTGFWTVWRNAYGNERDSAKKKELQFGSVVRVLLRTALQAIVIQSVVTAVDYHYYGRLVSPTWNIFVYNAQAGGDELYGVEPLSYYVKNLLLNFNFASTLGLASLPVLLLTGAVKRWLHPKENTGSAGVSGGIGSSASGMEIMVLLPMYIWMAVVFPRPHKEERFLFPIYPILCFGSAITLREVFSLLIGVVSLVRFNNASYGKGRNGEWDKTRQKSTILMGLVLLSPCALISISRSVALSRYYSAPLRVYHKLFLHATAASPSGKVTYVCTAGEWYRFPSSFFLPPNHQLGFLKSSFTGQLPQPFTSHGSKMESLAEQGGKFNDMNREEMDRYIDIEQCTYVVELVPLDLEINITTGDNMPEGLQYMNSSASSGGSWTKIASHNYLDADSTPLLHRILYIPFGRDGKVTYKSYNLYARDSIT